ARTCARQTTAAATAQPLAWRSRSIRRRVISAFVASCACKDHRTGGSMEALLHEIAHYVALVVEAIAILIIAIGSIEALVNILRALSRSNGIQKREGWLPLSPWLLVASC